MRRPLPQSLMTSTELEVENKYAQHLLTLLRDSKADELTDIDLCILDRSGLLTKSELQDLDVEMDCRAYVRWKDALRFKSNEEETT